jgi:murein L,D-transpeptidase YcbB/YkuD
MGRREGLIPRPNRRRLRAFLLLFLLVLAFRKVCDSPAAQSFPSLGSLPPVDVTDQLSPESQSKLRAIVEAGKLPGLRWPDFNDYRQEVKKFYGAYGYTLPWVRQMRPTRQAREVIAILLKADEKGLSVDDYEGPQWTERLAELKPTTEYPKESDALQFDVALTVSLMRYISDVRIGRLNPRHPEVEINVGDRLYGLAGFLKDQVVDGEDVPAVLSRVEPSFPIYQRTIRALQTYRQLARQDKYEALPIQKKAITPGHSFAGIQRLARFLSLVGDLPGGARVPAEGSVYEGAMVDAVKSFQRRHGLTPNGQIDAHTINEMNVPLNRRVRQIELTLERFRWFPSDYNRSLIIVNIPEFRLRAYDDDFNIALTMKVVVGKAYRHDTPVFANKMRHVIFRPSWNVPPSIAREEILPAIERDPSYLAKENLEIVDKDGHVTGSGTVTSEILQQVRTGSLSFRQRPGPKNSLGLVKFMFPNEYEVYMHDTPATELFLKSRRDFSHGCIRLEKPVDLALWVLRDNPGWDLERIQKTMKGDRTEEVNLAHPIPVIIVYGTVIVLADGVVHFYDDIYGQDAELDRALQAGYPYRGGQTGKKSG